MCAAKNKVPLWKKALALQKSDGAAPETAAAANESKMVVNKVPNELLLASIARKTPKKKRKKDKNAGLLYSIDKGDNSVRAVSNFKQKLQKLNIEKLSASRTLNQNPTKHRNFTKNKPSLQIQSKINLKANTKKKRPKNVPQPPAKRNNLLQLANALKANSNQSGATSQADKIKQLLS